LLITLTSTCTEASALVEKIGETGLYAGMGENAILLLVGTQALSFVWKMGKWIVDKYFREQKDKDAEVKKLKLEFHQFREDVGKVLGRIEGKMEGLAHLPDEDEVIKEMEKRMEFLVFKAVRDLGLKDGKR
jgi:hypothetical protein